MDKTFIISVIIGCFYSLGIIVTIFLNGMSLKLIFGLICSSYTVYSIWERNKKNN